MDLAVGKVVGGYQEPPKVIGMDIQVASESINGYGAISQGSPCEIGQGETGEDKHANDNDHQRRDRVADRDEKGDVDTVGCENRQQLPVNTVRPAK